MPNLTIADELREIAAALDGLLKDDAYQAQIARIRYEAQRLDGFARMLNGDNPDDTERHAHDLGNVDFELAPHGQFVCDPVEGDGRCPDPQTCPFLGRERDSYEDFLKDRDDYDEILAARKSEQAAITAAEDRVWSAQP